MRKKISELLTHNLVDSRRDLLVQLVQDVDGVVDLLAGVERRPQGGDREESMKPDLLVSGRLHPLDGLEFVLELLVVADYRVVVASLAHFLAEKEQNAIETANWLQNKAH